MIKRLRRKFIVVSVSAVFVVITVIVISINIINYIQVNQQSNNILDILLENDGYFPKQDKPKDENFLQRQNPVDKHKELTPEMPFSTRYFTVTIGKEGNIIKVDTGKIAAVSTDKAVDYATRIFQKYKAKGLIDVYRYRMEKKDDGYLLVFIDTQRELQMFYTFLGITIFVSMIGLSAVFILIVLFSKNVIKPVAESYEKQKQFITDVSHELKTPLAIIETNTEVIEIDNGISQWTTSIHHQTERLSDLVSSLLVLTRMDEDSSIIEMSEFSLSDAIDDTAQPFITLIENSGKTLILDIEKDLTYYGNEMSIRQLVSILLDNANKYALENTEIKLSLKCHNKKYIIQLQNQTKPMKPGSYNNLFERFYRMDGSRNSQTGGYGIGLSIAKAIVDKHKGRINAYSEDGNSITFSTYL